MGRNEIRAETNGARVLYMYMYIKALLLPAGDDLFFDGA
jgi:hypothetical protein